MSSAPAADNRSGFTRIRHAITYAGWIYYCYFLQL